MSEERFKLAEDEDGLILIYDTKKDKWIGFNSQVVDLLNFQDNGNILNHHLDFLKL